jgi:hypothetical protein
VQGDVKTALDYLALAINLLNANIGVSPSSFGMANVQRTWAGIVSHGSGAAKLKGLADPVSQSDKYSDIESMFWNCTSGVRVLQQLDDQRKQIESLERMVQDLLEPEDSRSGPDKKYVNYTSPLPFPTRNSAVGDANVAKKPVFRDLNVFGPVTGDLSLDSRKMKATQSTVTVVADKPMQVTKKTEVKSVSVATPSVVNEVKTESKCVQAAVKEVPGVSANPLSAMQKEDLNSDLPVKHPAVASVLPESKSVQSVVSDVLGTAVVGPMMQKSELNSGSKAKAKRNPVDKLADKNGVNVQKKQPQRLARLCKCKGVTVSQHEHLMVDCPTFPKHAPVLKFARVQYVYLQSNSPWYKDEATERRKRQVAFELMHYDDENYEKMTHVKCTDEIRKLAERCFDVLPSRDEDACRFCGATVLGL